MFQVVIPAKAGIQAFLLVFPALDPGFRRGDFILQEAVRNS
jgi:hypothetical protein